MSFKVKCNGCDGKGVIVYESGPDRCDGCGGKCYEEIATFNQYVNYMIMMGYWHEEDLEPIKCESCEGTNFKDYDYDYINHAVCEFSRKCADCGFHVGRWGYGSWQV